MSPRFSPGSLVRARGREWIVLAHDAPEVLRVRPVSGSEDDQTRIHLALESEPVTEASFPLPEVRQQSNQSSALLLRDALLLSLRRGAGPFRCFGQIAVEPRAYQLVPLLMALKLDIVRLLIADDVGIGKTIEAALIARELLDRGDISRLTVLCPPHLTDQWVNELQSRFHLRPVPVTAASAGRLERNLPPSESIFQAYPHTVVSLDYIKSERRRDDFLRACPEFVIVDEAHTCAATTQGRHQRYELLRGLADHPDRHLVLLSATPHSGDEEAFYRLLGLLNQDFARLGSLTGHQRDALRERLALHFVQRRRPDIAEWHEGQIFPRRQTKELTYKLTGDWDQFFRKVLDYCATVVESATGDERRQRLNFWGTLALLRCASSSPLAAVSALRSRAGLETGEEAREELLRRIFDGDAENLPEDDVEPAAGTSDPQLATLIKLAEELAGQSGDPKLQTLTDHLTRLLDEGFSPVVFCRYITTAHYLGRHLATKFKSTTVVVVTGELTSDERKEKIEALDEAEKRILIATDCLSEGINLQEFFDAVVHYDLSWNPTRHEQREGRVDRFGQKRDVVRTTLMYGVNNPVDGVVLDVILRKAETIREKLGVPVPMPDQSQSLTEALLRSTLLRHRGLLDTSSGKQLDLFDREWKDAAEKVKANRTVFAQRRLKPEEVLPEWNKSLRAVGGKEDVQRFTERAMMRLGAGLEKLSRGYQAPLDALPEDVRERLEAEGLTGSIAIDFSYPPAARCRPVQRSHPLIAILAETLLERTLAADPADGNPGPGVLGRVGCWQCEGISVMTTVLLLRLRFQLTVNREHHPQSLLVEEASALAWSPTSTLEGPDALALLQRPSVGEPPAPVRERQITLALQRLKDRLAELDAFADRRALALLEDHRRVREASRDRGRYMVQAIRPADVIGLFVVLPKVLG
ncbi:MAG: helicase-related protein [Myxococcales bacterium]|nr:DEAD/DEAH box helicase [Polyangiaceae bacterium]MDW8249055.1 helicase-related protein [Myxococcales bacterium]